MGLARLSSSTVAPTTKRKRILKLPLRQRLNVQREVLTRYFASDDDCLNLGFTLPVYE